MKFNQITVKEKTQYESFERRVKAVNEHLKNKPYRIITTVPERDVVVVGHDWSGKGWLKSEYYTIKDLELLVECI